MKITVIVETGEPGGMHGKRVVFERSRDLSDGNPAFYAKDVRNYGHNLVTEIVEQFVTLYGDAEVEPDSRKWPKTWRLG